MRCSDRGKGAGVTKVKDMARPIFRDWNQHREPGIEIARIIGALLCFCQSTAWK